MSTPTTDGFLTHSTRCFLVAVVLMIGSVVAQASSQSTEPARSPTLSELIKLADQGDATAAYNLGFRYDIGIGIPQDHAKAAGWYRKAADRGNADAQFTLGFMYLLGRGVPQDFPRP